MTHDPFRVSDIHSSCASNFSAIWSNLFKHQRNATKIFCTKILIHFIQIHCLNSNEKKDCDWQLIFMADHILRSHICYNLFFIYIHSTPTIKKMNERIALRTIIFVFSCFNFLIFVQINSFLRYGSVLSFISDTFPRWGNPFDDIFVLTNNRALDAQQNSLKSPTME